MYYYGDEHEHHHEVKKSEGGKKMEEKEIGENLGIISYKTYERILKAVASGGIPEIEVKHALENVYVYGIPKGVKVSK